MNPQRIFRRINPQTAQQLLARGDVLVFDSRDQASYEQSHIESARRLSSENLDATLLGTPKAVPVLVYCYHGNASQIYGQMFADFGFAEVYSLDGGYEAWRRLQQPAQGPALSPLLAQWLLEHGYPTDDLHAVADYGMTPLMRASKAGASQIVAELIQAGASLETRNADGNTALWMACVGASIETMDVLIRAGVALDHQNDNGATCLMYAASTGKHEVVDKLLSAGASPYLKTLDDFSALDMAATLECLRLLRAAEKAAASAA